MVERCRCQWRPDDTQSNSPMFSSIREVPQYGSMPPIPPSLIMYCFNFVVEVFGSIIELDVSTMELPTEYNNKHC
jgi:hypothetical protein